MNAPLPAVNDHRVFAMFSFRLAYGHKMDRCLRDLTDAPNSKVKEGTRSAGVANPSLQGHAGDRAKVWVSDGMVEGIASRYGNEAIWQSSEVPTGDELFPHIERMLSGQSDEDVHRYGLTDRAIRLLSHADLYLETVSRDERRSHDLMLLLRNGASSAIAPAIGAEEMETLKLDVQDANNGHGERLGLKLMIAPPSRAGR